MKKLVMVECISQFRIRYVVEVEDYVTNENAAYEVSESLDDPEFEEFSQAHIATLPISYREITRDEYLKMFDEDNDYLKSWDDEKKFRAINIVE